MRCLTALLLLLFSTGCGSQIAEFSVSDHLNLVVKKASSKKDTYLVVLAFKENTKYTDIVQEVTITNPRGVVFQLVETFDTSWSTLPPSSKFRTDFQPPTVEDHHWTEKASKWEKRRCNFYAAHVEGADRDSVGFAMLPQNMDGTVVTTASRNVNKSYRKGQVICGRIVDRHEETGSYEIEWEPNKLRVTTAVGFVVVENGKVRMQKTPQVAEADQEAIRLRRFGSSRRASR